MNFTACCANLQNFAQAASKPQKTVKVFFLEICLLYGCATCSWMLVLLTGEVTVYDSCVGGAVHRARGLGHVTSLDLRWSHASLIVGVATLVTDLGPGEYLIRCNDVDTDCV